MSQPTHQKSKENTEQKVLLKLMSRLENEPLISQRTLASELGIALGLMNTYLKRCIKKGWVRAKEVPARRLAYYVTPEGFKEKSRMVGLYISTSLNFFRDARSQCEAIFSFCEASGWKNIALLGEGDLTEIALLVAHSHKLEIHLASREADFSQFDGVLITDIIEPQSTYDWLEKKIGGAHRILTLPLMHISKQSQSMENVG